MTSYNFVLFCGWPVFISKMPMKFIQVVVSSNSFSTLFFFFKLIFVTLCPSHFYINFRFSLSMFTKKAYWDFNYNSVGSSKNTNLTRNWTKAPRFDCLSPQKPDSCGRCWCTRKEVFLSAALSGRMAGPCLKSHLPTNTRQRILSTIPLPF